MRTKANQDIATIDEFREFVTKHGWLILRSSIDMDDDAELELFECITPIGTYLSIRFHANDKEFWNVE